MITIFCQERRNIIFGFQVKISSFRSKKNKETQCERERLVECTVAFLKKIERRTRKGGGETSLHAFNFARKNPDSTDMQFIFKNASVFSTLDFFS
jgi:hypothetical protein